VVHSRCSLEDEDPRRRQVVVRATARATESLEDFHYWAARAGGSLARVVRQGDSPQSNAPSICWPMPRQHREDTDLT